MPSERTQRTYHRSHRLSMREERGGGGEGLARFTGGSPRGWEEGDRMGCTRRQFRLTLKAKLWYASRGEDRGGSSTGGRVKEGGTMVKDDAYYASRRQFLQTLAATGAIAAADLA